MDRLDPVFNALADATRRAILARLAQGEATVGALSEPFSISAPAISRHLKIVEEASLITNERHGKQRVCRLKPETLAGAQEWLDFSHRFWSGSFAQLDRHLKTSGKETA